MAHNDSIRYCECGCGEVLTRELRFKPNHGKRPSVFGPILSPDDPRGPNPSGLCLCGCWGIAPIALKSENGMVRGCYARFIQDHGKRAGGRITNPDDPRGPNPSGICLCGCGEAAPISNDNCKGRVRGCYSRFLHGHDKRTRSRSGTFTGICLCGCGLNTPIATFSLYGNVAGQPRLYYNQGHGQRGKPTVDSVTGCWLFPARNGDGYSRIHRNNRLYLGHVWFWEQRFGPVPEDRELDHICRNRNCVNPEHLEPVTHRENMTRIIYEAEIPFLTERPQYTIVESGCWLFNFVQEDGYARVWNDGILMTAHKAFWQAEYGAVPKGLELDHLCRNRACVNPSHLEAVTHLENCRRSHLPKAVAPPTDIG